MYDKIQQGKHIKKIGKVEVSAQDTSVVKKEKKKKGKALTVQQLNVEVKTNQ